MRTVVFLGLRFYDSSEFHFIEAVNYVVMLGVSGKEHAYEKNEIGCNRIVNAWPKHW